MTDTPEEKPEQPDKKPRKKFPPSRRNRLTNDELDGLIEKATDKLVAEGLTADDISDLPPEFEGMIKKFEEKTKDRREMLEEQRRLGLDEPGDDDDDTPEKPRGRSR